MDQTLSNSIKDGGYILYVRHADASIGEDLPKLDLFNCFTQRNLSGNGKMQAINYGNMIRTLKVPISYPVEVSPYCRTIETGLLAFGGPNIKVEPVWKDVNELSKDIDSTDKERIIHEVRTKFETEPPEGTNKLIIGHSFPRGVELGQIDNLETVVIKPLGEGNGYQVVGRITRDEMNHSINRILNADNPMNSQLRE